MTTMTENSSLEELIEEHRYILRQAADHTPFRSMPEGGREAIDAGLVRESDPTWMYSDDHRKANGFTLTELGHRAVEQLGWQCACAGCRWQSRRLDMPVQPSVDGFCKFCRSNSRAGSSTRTAEGECCEHHRRMMERAGEFPGEAEEQPLTWRWYESENLGWIALGSNANLSEEDTPKRGDEIIIEGPPGQPSSAHTVSRIFQTRPHDAKSHTLVTVIDDAHKEAVIAAVALSRGESPKAVEDCGPPVWHWRRAGKGWIAEGDEPLGEDDIKPEPGDMITVVRRDGTRSQHLIGEVLESSGEKKPRARVSKAMKDS